MGSQSHLVAGAQRDYAKAFWWWWWGGGVSLRVDSEVSLVSAGQTERKLDGGCGGVSGTAQAPETGNNQRFVLSYTSRKPATQL